MSKDQLEKATISFQSSANPLTGEKLEASASMADFIKVEDPKFASALFKQAAYDKIQESKSKQKQIELSQKYQVLCEHTSLIGVIKQKKKPTGEVQVERRHYKPQVKQDQQMEMIADAQMVSNCRRKRYQKCFHKLDQWLINILFVCLEHHVRVVDAELWTASSEGLGYDG